MSATDLLAESATLSRCDEADGDPCAAFRPLTPITSASAATSATSEPLDALLAIPTHDPQRDTPPLVTVGELLALTDQGRVPLVSHPHRAGQAALRARSVIDLHAAHIGRRVVLMFERGQASLPIVLGVLRETDDEGWPRSLDAGRVELEQDGERLIVSATRELVLRCGQASVRLCHDGRIQIAGQSIVIEADAATRIRGGSVELN